MTIAKAKGRGVKDIPQERLDALNDGAEATNLTECLAVDFAKLMHVVLPQISAQSLAEMEAGAASGISQRMRLAVSIITRELGEESITQLAHHSSDTVRGWCCFMVDQRSGLSLDVRLEAIKPFADDPHFGVREWSWMAVRGDLAANLDETIRYLTDWTLSSSERIRRFATESIRPRGVWCQHIAQLKKMPELALPVLAALKADPSIYVQDSVANWLNDASKDCPEWVQNLCVQWQASSSSAATQRICKRALRSIRA